MQLPLLIRFGFPLDFDNKENDTSAKLFPEDVDAYLEEEIRH